MAKQKSLLISGGSSGLGAAVIEHFAKQNWRVIVLTRMPEAMNRVQNVEYLRCDHTVPSLDALKDTLTEMLTNGLDLLVNNAGFALVGALETLNEEQISQEFQVNFLSHVTLTKICIPFLRINQGKIFNISSLFGSMGCPFHSLYCASKYAIEGFSEALHYELKPQRIQCCAVVPGRHHTNFGKNMHIIEPNDSLKALYQEQYNGFYKLKSELTDKKANEPKKFAQKIFALANQNKLDPKIAVNADSLIPHLLRKYIPNRIYCWLQNKMFAKYFYPKECL